MNLMGLRCACRPRAVLPLDHYTSGACPDPPFMLEWIEDILDDVTSDTLHRDGNITATRLLGCPRETVLLDNLPVALDPGRLHNAKWGSVFHDRLHQRAARGTYAEVSLPPDGAEPPILFGVPVRGKVDKVRADFSEICDWKTHGETSHQIKYRLKQAGRIDRELAAQLNIYRILIARSVLKVPDDQFRPVLTAWHVAQVRARRGPGEPPPKPRGKSGWMPEEPPPPGFRVRLPIMSEEEIARMRPFDDDEAPGTQPYTVRDFVGMYEGFRRDRAAGMAMQDAVRKNLPLVGRGVWKGTKCTRYCAALELCDGIEGVQR